MKLFRQLNNGKPAKSSTAPGSGNPVAAADQSGLVLGLLQAAMPSVAEAVERARDQSKRAGKPLHLAVFLAELLADAELGAKLGREKCARAQEVLSAIV